MKTMKMMLPMMLITLGLAPFRSFAADGTAGGGGGDPIQIQDEIKAKKSSLAESIRKSSDQRLRQDQIDALELNKYAAIAAKAMRFYSAIGYPLRLDPRITAELIENTIRKLIRSGRIQVVQGPLTLADENGNQKQVTFISHPETQTMFVDSKRLSELPGKRGQLEIELVATVVHEVLVLNRIEPSMTYTFSSKIALALRDLTDSGFNDWAATLPAFNDCNRVATLAPFFDSNGKQNALKDIPLLAFGTFWDLDLTYHKLVTTCSGAKK